MSKRTPLAEQPTQIYGRRPVYRPAPPPPPDLYLPWQPRRAVSGCHRAPHTLFFAGWRCRRRRWRPCISQPAHLSRRPYAGCRPRRAQRAERRVPAGRELAGARHHRGRGSGARTHRAPAALGLILDGPATASRAHQQGRDLAALPEALRYRASSQGFPPVWYYNPEIARAALAELAPQLAIAPVDAGIALENGRVVATQAVPGRALDVAASLAWLQQNAVQVLQQGRFSLLLLAEVTPAISRQQRARRRGQRAPDPAALRVAL
jgi:hypothetical protein